MDKNTPKAGAGLYYPVLTPFKRRGNIIKPPASLQLSADDAAPYLAAQVIGEGVESPAHEADAPRYEHLEAERLEAERLEAERLEAERLEAERLEAERLEAERLEAERLEAERLEAERLEAERLEAERVEAERLEAEAKAKADGGKTITPDTTPKPEVKPAAGEPAAGKTGSKPKAGGK